MDNGFMHPQGNARKRLKISRTGKASPAPAPGDAAIMPPNPTTNGEGSAAVQQHTGDGNCHHETALKSLHTDIDAMRHLVTCQICHRFMYEPYALACGHTYCYSCLTQWFDGKPKKTCPDCRTVINQQPTPSYVLRELVIIFAGRNQLLSDGETAEEHTKDAKDEAELVVKDKANTDPRTGGLFKGAFNRGGRLRLLPIHDPGDNVDRCPRCHWEVEDGVCNQCGNAVGDEFSDFSGDSMNTDDELDHVFDDYDDQADFGVGAEGLMDTYDADLADEDDMGADDVDPAVMRAAFGGPRRPVMRLPGIRRNRRGTPAPIQLSSDRSEDESSEEDDSDMDGFIEDDDAHAGGEPEAQMDDSEEDDTVQEVSHRPRRRGHAQVVISDDDEEEEIGATQAGAISVEDSDDEAPILGTSGRTKRNRAVPRQRPIAVSSESESSSEDDDVYAQPAPGSVSGGFSPLQEGSDDEHASTSIRTDRSDAGSVHSQAYYGQDEDADASESESSDSENGWATRADLPPGMLDPRNRLQNGAQHRNRHVAAPVSRTLHHSPSISHRGLPVPTLRSHSRSLAGRAPPPAPRPGPTFPARANHPFQLDNTLASINRRSRLQTPEDPQTSRSVSAASSQSSVGGVDVHSSPSGSSSSGSSRTVGRADSAPAAETKRPFNRYIDYDAVARVYNNAPEEYDDEDDEDDDEY